ncbi:MAG: hypothetical protein ABIH49_02765 [archaeon]
MDFGEVRLPHDIDISHFPEFPEKPEKEEDFCSKIYKRTQRQKEILENLRKGEHYDPSYLASGLYPIGTIMLIPDKRIKEEYGKLGENAVGYRDLQNKIHSFKSNGNGNGKLECLGIEIPVEYLLLT